MHMIDYKYDTIIADKADQMSSNFVHVRFSNTMHAQHHLDVFFLGLVSNCSLTRPFLDCRCFVHKGANKEGVQTHKTNSNEQNGGGISREISFDARTAAIQSLTACQYKNRWISLPKKCNCNQLICASHSLKFP